MIRPPPRSTLFPSTPLFRSLSPLDTALVPADPGVAPAERAGRSVRLEAVHPRHVGFAVQLEADGHTLIASPAGALERRLADTTDRVHEPPVALTTPAGNSRGPASCRSRAGWSAACRLFSPSSRRGASKTPARRADSIKRMDTPGRAGSIPSTP